jgi:hypothetical protein
MFNPHDARTDLAVFATDARHWQQVARTPEKEIFWHDRVLVYELALATLEYALDNHAGISCHPDSDCDHEDPDFGQVLSRIPSTAEFLTSLRTTKQVLAGEVSKTLLNLIGKLAQARLEEARYAE